MANEFVKGVLERNSHFILITFLIVIDVGVSQMIVEMVVQVEQASVLQMTNPYRHTFDTRKLSGYLMVKSAILITIAFACARVFPKGPED